jgi:dihydrofolate synthase/folylpolyglutamate synthase
MAYSDIIDWVFNLERFGIKLGLENMSEFMTRIGNPERDLKSVHVTGTNGKGSVCAMVSSILRASGLKVGLYTSPHLVDFRERIVVDGRQIPEDDVVRIASELRPAMDDMAGESNEKQLTFFEFSTGLAFKYFREQKVDIVIAEVGMGGRLDATNVLMPETAVITRIGLEHTNYLGGTVAEIAREKAGIVKEEVPTITSERNPEALAVIGHACTRKHSPLKRIDEDFVVRSVRQSLNGTSFGYRGDMVLEGLRTTLIGRYQAENAGTAVAVCETLNGKGYTISEDDVRRGLKKTTWHGRLDIVSTKPLVILDGSHNPDGVGTTVGVLKELKVTPLTYVLGCMDDKDVRGIARALSPTASRIICTQAQYKRALSAERLAEAVRTEFAGPVDVIDRPAEAFEAGLDSKDGRGVCIVGSLYLVGEAIPWWNARNPRSPGRSRTTYKWPVRIEAENKRL